MPFRSRENILAIYSPRKYIIPEADMVTVDTEINIVLPLNTTLYVTTKFKGQKIKEISGPQKKKITNNAVESILFSKTSHRKGEYCWLRAITKL